MSESDISCGAVRSSSRDHELADIQINEGRLVTSDALDNRDHQNKRPEFT